MARIARILVTPGEPAGIGPDLVVQIAQRAHAVELVAVADPALLARRARLLGLPLQLRDYDARAAAAASPAGQLSVLAIPLGQREVPGRLDPANASYVLQTLATAASLCLAGQAQALVTGPVQKSVINEAGFAFSGHTEYLAQRCGTPLPVMMLAAGSLRVALATTHLALRAVPDAIRADTLESVLRILDRDLRSRFGFAHPRILVCGLNPHAGEAGHLGREEIDVIAPVLQRLRVEGLQLEGPLPADTVFTPGVLARGDAVLAMYHDQGLTALKYAGFGEAVNITLGLPMIRTSVDHGTALDLAGTGKAHTGSLLAALALAIELSVRA